jgi:hypothetical protein
MRKKQPVIEEDNTPMIEGVHYKVHSAETIHVPYEDFTDKCGCYYEYDFMEGLHFLKQPCDTHKYTRLKSTGNSFV